ncbi:MAG: DUF4430 domain-containing protein [Oscillospiraceae bacterium]|nr:DUF4430 domain-containing protein [Oscillospiraceae bacterium]
MKALKKSVSLLLALIMLMSACCAFASAASDIKVNVRIEGINDKLFYGNVTVPSGATVLDAIKQADSVSSKIKVTVKNGAYGAYVTAVNNEKEKTFGGYDGWNYRVNGVDPSVSMDKYKVKSGAKIILYYGDPYGKGMQYPVADTSMLAAGYLSFKSTDTVYRADGTTKTTESIITGYILEWGLGNGATVDLYPDENGLVYIDKEFLTKGEHSVQIIKTDDSGMPLVLRFAPDYMINVTEIADEKSDNPTINAIYEMRDFIEQIIAFIKELVNVFQNIKIDI